MFDLICLEWRFLFHRTTIWIITVFFAVFLGAILYSSNVFQGFGFMDMQREEYAEVYLADGVQIIKFVSMFLLIFVGILMNTETHRNLAKYIVSHPTMKFKYQIASLIFQMLVAFTLIGLLVSVFHAFTVTMTPYHFEQETITLIAKSLLLQGCVYISLTNLLMIVLPHLITGLVPIVLFWIMEMNTDILWIAQNPVFHLLYQYVPNLVLNNGEWLLYSDELRYLSFLLISLLLGMILQVRKDIL